MKTDQPPKCACGCGQPVGKRGARKAWNKYIHGHHARVKNPNAKGHAPWNKGNTTRYDHVCGYCGKGFTSKAKVAKYCSNECRFLSKTGEGSHFWKGGNRTSYRFIWKDGKAQREHRVLMAKHLGRELKRRERVHHIDGDGLNNTLGNLHLFHCEGCHQFHHKSGASLEYIYGEVH